MRCVVLGLFVALGAGCNGGIPNPQSDVANGQAMLDLHELIVQVREDNANLQAQIDSLHTVIARQDTLIRMVAAQAGVPLPPPPPQ